MLGDLAGDHVEEELLDLGGDRAARARTDGTAVQLADRRHFRRSAGEERFVGDVDVVAAYLQGGAGDKWVLSGNFENRSLLNLTWDTLAADLAFDGGNTHQLYLPGADLGRTRAGYSNNFAWSSLDLRGQSLTLLDGNDTPGGALYVGSILGAILSGGQIANIYGNGLDIYYDPSLPDNAYLAGLAYALADGGYLAPVPSNFLGPAFFGTQLIDTTPTPVPGTVWLLLSGLAGLGLWRRKLGRPRP